MASMYLGSASNPTSAPSWTADGVVDGARAGSAVASAGDVNGDGYSDVIVASTGYYVAPNPNGIYGRVDVYYGSSSGVPTSPFVVSYW